MLGWELLGQRLVTRQLYDHHANLSITVTPILVFDCWEHAYYLRYRNARPDYLDRLWTLVNWADVARRFDAARAGTPWSPSAPTACDT